MEHVIYIYILAMGENSLISWCEWGYALGHHSLLGVATLLSIVVSSKETLGSKYT